MSESLGERLSGLIETATRDRTGHTVLAHAAANRPHFKRTIADLPAPEAPEGAAVVIAGGACLRRKNQLQALRESRFSGTVVAADAALGPCLRAGVTPDYVVTVGDHSTRILRWFGDPALETRSPDDFFAKDDPALTSREAERTRNRELIGLVDAAGPRMKALIATGVDPNVTARLLSAKVELYWWNPLYDDPEKEGSVARRLFDDNGIACLANGGNVASGAWVLTHAVLRRKHVALLGFDWGYPPGTPAKATHRYADLSAALGRPADDAYLHVANPHLGETWLTDPTFYWYRQAFVELAAQAECTTYNCTEGGILFGDPVRFEPFQSFLKRFA